MAKPCQGVPSYLDMSRHNQTRWRGHLTTPISQLSSAWTPARDILATHLQREFIWCWPTALFSTVVCVCVCTSVFEHLDYLPISLRCLSVNNLLLEPLGQEKMSLSCHRPLRYKALPGWWGKVELKKRGKKQFVHEETWRNVSSGETPFVWSKILCVPLKN